MRYSWREARAPDFIVARGAGTRLRRLGAYTPRASGYRAPCSESGSAPLSRGYAPRLLRRAPTPHGIPRSRAGCSIAGTHRDSASRAAERRAPARSMCAPQLRTSSTRPRPHLLRAADGLPETRGGRTVSICVAGGGASGCRQRERVAPRRRGLRRVLGYAPSARRLEAYKRGSRRSPNAPTTGHRSRPHVPNRRTCTTARTRDDTPTSRTRRSETARPRLSPRARTPAVG